MSKKKKFLVAITVVLLLGILAYVVVNYLFGVEYYLTDMEIRSTPLKSH